MCSMSFFIMSKILIPGTPVLNSRCNVNSPYDCPVTTSLLATEPGTKPALCLCGILGDLLVELGNRSVEILACLASEVFASSAGLIPLLLCLDTQGVVLRLGLSTVFLGLVLRLAAVLLGLVLCLLTVGPQVGLGLLCLGAGAVGLPQVSIHAIDKMQVSVDDVRSPGQLRGQPHSPLHQPS